VAIAAIAFVIAVAAREAGFFERADLAVHDRLVRSTYQAAPEDRFVIVLESEADLRRWKYPLSDEIFAQLLARILEADPAAVAIDKYRDVPVEPGTARLAELLRASDRVYWVKKFGSRPSEDVPTPAALDEKFAGCGDLVHDRDGIVRRGLLYVDDAQRVCYSLGYRLASHMARGKGLVFSIPKEDPDRYDLGKSHVRAFDSCDGPYAYADAAGFQVAFPSATRPSIQTIALSDVLDGKVPPERFRGKVVLFGSGAESLGDFFNVPALTAEGYEKVPGVAIHAIFASYLLQAADATAVTMRLAPRGVGLALAAIFAFAAAFVACARRSLPLTVAGFSAIGALLAIATLAMAHQGIFTAPTAAAVALSIAFVAGIVRSEWLERQGVLQKLSAPFKLTKRSLERVEEPAYSLDV